MLSLMVLEDCRCSAPEFGWHAVTLGVPEVEIGWRRRTLHFAEPGIVELPPIPHRCPRIALVEVRPGGRSRCEETVGLGVYSCHLEVDNSAWDAHVRLANREHPGAR